MGHDFDHGVLTLMVPGETWHAPRGVPGMTLVVISEGAEDQVYRDVDPLWNVAVHPKKNTLGGMTFIANLRPGTLISNVPTQPRDARFVITTLQKSLRMPTLLVLVHEDYKGTVEWPRKSRSTAWDRINDPLV